MEINLLRTKKYEVLNLTNMSGEVDLFNGYYKDYTVSETLLRKLFKDIGVPFDIYKEISEMSSDIAKSILSRSKYNEILLLLDDHTKSVLSYSLEVERTPILNDDFINRILSMVEASNHVIVSEINYNNSEVLSSILIKKIDPVIIEEKYENADSILVNYEVGILLTNDETNSTSSRLVVYQEGQPLYLPFSYYNATTTRFKRSTDNNLEALEVLLLKVIEDMRENILSDRLYDFHYIYRSNKSICASYEEYNTLLRVLRKVPTIIEDSDILSNLESKYYDFEQKYRQIDDQKSSYIWRCTASTDLTIGTLIRITSAVLSELNAPAEEYSDIRDLLGNYMSTKRIAVEIAKERNL